jgi:ABC-type multidrug transport system fused ATPase/permease subunit
LIDGVPIESLRLADLRAHLALVSQDILLFNATVAQNIAYGKSGATRVEVITAAREAYAHEFIEALPLGYDTPLGERGIRLSGGQRQRIAIARAFVRNAPILVLDEATASLDSQSEAEVQKAIDHLAEHRTVICVAHRLSTLRAMDRILVLQKGRIVEQGDFDQLLAARGIFTAMAARQSIFPQPVLTDGSYASS